MAAHSAWLQVRHGILAVSTTQPFDRAPGQLPTNSHFPLPLPQGVTWRRFLVLLHHTPGKYSRRGLEDAMGVCSGYSIECRWASCMYCCEA